MTSKDQRYTQKKRKLSKKTTCKGEITDRQITLRVGEEELALLEMWMKQKDLTMTEVIEEILSMQENKVSSYSVQDRPETKHGKRIAGGKTVKRICVWIRSTLHDKAKDHGGKSMVDSCNCYCINY
jgi:hypothetical protein